MFRIKKRLDRSLKTVLAKYVCEKFGKELTRSFECERLSGEIKIATGSNIGANTLRRFFGFLQTNFSPSPKTLDTLSEYAGFHDWHSFSEQVTSTPYEPLTLNQEALFYLNFYKIEIRTEGDMNYHNACRNIAFRILFNTVLLSKLAPILAKIPVSQIYFFERFPYIDGLGKGYKRSIHFYLQNKNDEAQIFGNCLLFLSAFLCRNAKELRTYHDRINKFSLRDSLHPFVIARYIGSNILYALVTNESADVWITEAFKWNKFFLHKRNLSFWRYPYYQHMQSDYLNLAGYFKDSLQIVKTKDQIIKPYEIEQGYEEALDVIYHVARHAHSGDNYKKWMTAKDRFSNITPLFKKYFELQATCVHRSVLPKGRKKEKLSERISELIEQTGFTYFENYPQLP